MENLSLKHSAHGPVLAVYWHTTALTVRLLGIHEFHLCGRCVVQHHQPPEFPGPQLGYENDAAEDLHEIAMDRDDHPLSTNISLSAPSNAFVEVPTVDPAPGNPAVEGDPRDYQRREAPQPQGTKRQQLEPGVTSPGSPRQRRALKRPRESPSQFVGLQLDSPRATTGLDSVQHFPRPSPNHRDEGARPRVDLSTGGDAEAASTSTLQPLLDSPTSGNRRRRPPISYAVLNGDKQRPPSVDPPQRPALMASPSKKASRPRKKPVSTPVVSSPVIPEPAVPCARAQGTAVPVAPATVAAALPIGPPSGWENPWLRVGINNTMDLFRKYSFLQAQQAVYLHQLALVSPQAQFTPIFQQLVMQYAATSSLLQGLTASFAQLPKQVPVPSALCCSHLPVYGKSTWYVPLKGLALPLHVCLSLGLHWT